MFISEALRIVGNEGRDVCSRIRAVKCFMGAKCFGTTHLYFNQTVCHHYFFNPKINLFLNQILGALFSLNDHSWSLFTLSTFVWSVLKFSSVVEIHRLRHSLCTETFLPYTLISCQIWWITLFLYRWFLPVRCSTWCPTWLCQASTQQVKIKKKISNPSPTDFTI